MYDKYLITGATGFLGRTVVEELVHHDAQVRALVLHNDPYINLLPKEVHTIVGDVCDKNSLADFFADADSRRVQTQPETLSGQCGRNMENPPAMFRARCGKVNPCQLRPCHTGKTRGLRYHGKL